MSGVIAGLLAGIHALLSLFFGHGTVALQPAQPFSDGQTPAQIVQQVVNPLPVAPVVTPPADTSNSVAGMSKYTDTDFGFSFWYPTAWTITHSKTMAAADIRGSKDNDIDFVDKILISDGNGKTIEIELYSSVDRLITDVGGGSMAAVGVTYSFDTTSHTWLQTTYPDNKTPQVVPADVSQNTMGGLHMFAGTSCCDTTIIPLSAHNFVVVNDSKSANSAVYLARTVVASDPSVATPISAEKQSATIDFEAKAYGVLQVSALTTLNVPQVPLILAYTNDFVAAKDISASDKDRTVAYMSVDCGTSLACVYYIGPEIDDVESASFSLRSNTDTTYEDCLNATSGKSVQASVNDVTWLKDSTGDAGLGHRVSTDTYRTYYSGACYEAYLSIAWNVGQGGGPDQTRFQALQKELTDIMQSVRFTAPETLPKKHADATPAWKTMRSTHLPVTFSYPGSFLAYDGEDEAHVGPGTTSGLDVMESEINAGSIDVQRGYVQQGATGVQAMQASMKTDPIAYPSFTYASLSLGGEPASITTSRSSTLIYVAHGDGYYRIILWTPLLPEEYQTFVNSFAFTN